MVNSVVEACFDAFPSLRPSAGPHPRPHPIGWGWEIPPIIAKIWMRKVKNIFSHACGNILVGRHTKLVGPNCGKVEYRNTERQLEMRAGQHKRTAEQRLASQSIFFRFRT